MSPDPILGTLGLALRAGRLEVGEEPVGAACRARHAKLILVADNAAPNTFRRAAHFAEAGGAPCLPVPRSKEELGAALGRASCAMAALTDVGMAAALMEKLSTLDPGRYGPAAAQLEERARAAMERAREQRRHERNIRRGRKKPPAAPLRAARPPAERPGREGERPAPHEDRTKPGPGGHKRKP